MSIGTEQGTNRRPVVLDTDIGTDVDDILALVLLAGAAELDLVGVSTVYGDTTLRAKITRHVLDQLGLAAVPIGIGATETLTGRPIWWPGHEGVGIPNLDEIDVSDSSSAADLFKTMSQTHAGSWDLFAIGPLTNVAAAITADPAFAASLHHLYIMGGAFWMEKPEHNIRCDPEAAEIVFASGIPMTACGLDVTTKVWLTETDLDRIREATSGLGPVLEVQVRRWWDFIGAEKNNPHDPLAILPAIQPDLFLFEQHGVEVSLAEGEVGRTRLTPNGTTRIAAEVQSERAEQEIVERIVAVS